jgi:hypothetical protein
VSYHHIIAALTAALLLAAPLAAQSATRDAPADSSRRAPVTVLVADPVATSVAGPNTNALDAGLSALTPSPAGSILRLRLLDTLAAPVLLPPLPARTSRNAALMIVGGAGMIAGAVIGGRSGGAIMVGGAVVGLIGLWRYLD